MKGKYTKKMKTDVGVPRKPLSKGTEKREANLAFAGGFGPGGERSLKVAVQCGVKVF